MTGHIPMNNGRVMFPRRRVHVWDKDEEKTRSATAPDTQHDDRSDWKTTSVSPISDADDRHPSEYACYSLATTMTTITMTSKASRGDV
ncbi:unnamed protein product [Heligmosomoides polygyrus]|uniref:ORF1 n=1 Tax=Heligmosomoides polygyrus TaxID=6339 RepID=A0A183FJH0_HELPZ|nr:unnamed protein product [Heligmosomoides polygyrus]